MTKQDFSSKLSSYPKPSRFLYVYIRFLLPISLIFSIYNVISQIIEIKENRYIYYIFNSYIASIVIGTIAILITFYSYIQLKNLTYVGFCSGIVNILYLCVIQHVAICIAQIINTYQIVDLQVDFEALILQYLARITGGCIFGIPVLIYLIKRKSIFIESYKVENDNKYSDKTCTAMKEISYCMNIISPIASLCGIIIFFGCAPVHGYRIYVVMCAVITIINSVLQVKYGEQNSLTTEIITSVIGAIVGVSTSIGIMYGISIALCIADLVLLVFGWISVIFSKAIREDRELKDAINQKREKKYSYNYRTVTLDEDILNDSEKQQTESSYSSSPPPPHPAPKPKPKPAHEKPYIQTHYDILCLDRYATPDEIKLAYRKQAAHYHPDVFWGSKEYAVEIMQKINDAYDTLKDDQKRAEYDNKIFR